MIETPIQPPQDGREAHSAPRAPCPYAFPPVSLFKKPPLKKGAAVRTRDPASLLSQSELIITCSVTLWPQASWDIQL